MKRCMIGVALLPGVFGLAWASITVAADAPTTQSTTQPAERVGEKHSQAAKEDLAQATEYLIETQHQDGGWGQPGSPAITALVLKALLQQPGYTAQTPVVARGFKFVLSFSKPDGGIYDPKGGVENYTTSVVLMALVAAKDEQFKPQIAKAVRYLKGIQIVEGSQTPEGQTVTKDNPFYGGTSYGSDGRPDLSNLSMTVDALHEAGVKPSDPFFVNAVVFLERTQNRAESNDQPWAAVVNDGGFAYASSGETKAGEIEIDGKRGLRSYGSMTYAGFKSMLYAGLKKDDPRVRAAYDWIRQYWRLDSNPNMPGAQSKEGLYYYYLMFAKALRAWDQDVITDTRGVKHNWREELIETLHERQRADGSWVNEADRWYESMPELVTAYAVLAIEEAMR